MSYHRQIKRVLHRYTPKYQLYARPARRYYRRSRRYRSSVLLSAAAVAVVTGAALFWPHPAATKPAAVTRRHQAVAPAVASLPSRVLPTPAPLDTGHAYGIAAGSSLTALSDAALDQRLCDIAATGAVWVRYDFDWSIIQSDDAHHYNWDAYDKLVAESSKYHLQVLGILDYTPAWARVSGCDNSHCAPADPSAYAAFATAVAQRYGAKGVHAWEIWNEPNNKDFWQPNADPAAYVQLLKQAYPAIKRADGAAIVLTGGLAPQATGDGAYAPVDFLKGVYDQGGSGSFDAVADHPYTFPLTPLANEDHAWHQMAAATGSLRALMVANGDNSKKIWLTEFGAPTGGPGPLSTIDNPNLDEHPYKVDEALQAKILADAITLYKGYDWVGPLMVYSYRDAGTSPDTNENFFGLTRADGSHKPAYDVFKAAATASN